VKVLVTGGAGYLGSVLLPELLGAGHGVRVLDSLMYTGESLLPVWSHPAFEFVRGDVRDRNAVRESVRGMDGIVHLAAIVGDPACSREPGAARAVNQEASERLLEDAARAGVRRFVFASTCSNYGKMADPTGYVDETAELRPVSLYAETKVAVERAILDGASGGELLPTSLRFATLFGVSPRMRFDLTVNEFTMELLTKKALVVFGEQFWRPYVHIKDAAAAIMAVLRAPDDAVDREVFNVGSTRLNYQKQQLVEMITPLVPDAAVEYVHRQEDPRDYRVSFEKIERKLGFTAAHTVESGIHEVASLVDAGVIADYSAARYRN
jgi:nucleoside-diphosphate-sugar epimerase